MDQIINFYNSFDFKQDKIITHLMFKIVLLIFIMLTVSYSFVVQARRGWRKCFRAEYSPDKTLQVKFGFPRRHRENCDVRFSVQVIEGEESRQTISSQLYKCHQMQPTEPAVIKHTSQQYAMDGYYRVCAQVLDDKNQDLVMEIHIGQKLNPLMYGDGQESLPLIQAQQLIDLDLTIQSIKKSLGWSQKLATQCKQDGDKLDINIQQMQNLAMNATILQIIFLIAYGIFWIIFMKSQKRNGSENYQTSF